MRTRSSVQSLNEEGIICTYILPDVDIDLEAAKESVATGRQLAQGRKRPVMVVFGKVRSLSREARAYFAGEETSLYTSAIALVIESQISKIIGNFMIGLNKTVYPTKLFTSEEEALSWLRTFLK